MSPLLSRSQYVGLALSCIRPVDQDVLTATQVCDQMGHGVIFRIKRVALLSKLQRAYACTVGQDVASLK